MARILTGVLLVALSLIVVGCGSSKPMRFMFDVPSGTGQIKIDEGGTESGDTGKIYTLKSNDAEKTIELTWNGKKIYGKMDVFSHTTLTRVTTVPIHVTAEIFNAVDDFKAVTYVVYERYRDWVTQYPLQFHPIFDLPLPDSSTQPTGMVIEPFS